VGDIRCNFEAESRRLKLAACSQFTKRNEFILETCFQVPSCKYAVALLFLGLRNEKRPFSGSISFC